MVINCFHVETEPAESVKMSPNPAHRFSIACLHLLSRRCRRTTGSDFLFFFYSTSSRANSRYADVLLFTVAPIDPTEEPDKSFYRLADAQ